MNFEQEARIRARRRKSKWNLLLIPAGVFGIGLTWFVLAHLMFLVHRVYYPTQRFGQTRTNLGGCLMFVPLLFPAIGSGLMFANLVVWVIPPARRVLDTESKGVSGASFTQSMQALGKFTFVALLVALALSLLGAIDPF